MAPDDFAYLLDTSALLALIEDEPGADQVEAAISSGNAVIPSLALLEVHYVTAQEKGKAEADRRYAWLKELSVELVWELDEATLLAAAGFKAQHRVSLADAWIAACASRRGLTLMHKDPEFEALKVEVPQRQLPYKGD